MLEIRSGFPINEFRNVYLPSCDETNNNGFPDYDVKVQGKILKSIQIF